MCLNIMKKEIYDKLKNVLKDKFGKITNNFFTDLFENTNKEKEIDTNDNFESKTKEDSNSFEDYEDFDIDNDFLTMNENNKSSNEYIMSNFINSIVDFNINELNSNLINHSELKMDDDYKIYENILINSLISKINENLEKEEKSFDELFLIINKIISIQKDDINTIDKDNENNLNVIRRTKKIIFCRIIRHLAEYIIKKIKEDFLEYLDCKIKNKNIRNKNIISKNTNIILNQKLKNKITEEQELKIINIYNKEITEIKNDLINIENNEIDLYKINKEVILEIINDYLVNGNCYYAIVLKEILSYFYIEMEYYSILDGNIINILYKNNNKNIYLYINESL